MQRVTLPNGDTIDYPDDMAPAMVEALTKHHLARQNVSTTDDVIGAAKYAVPKAITGVLGFGGDVRDLAKAGKEKILSVLPDWVRTADSAIPNPFTIAGRVLPTSSQLRSTVENATAGLPGGGEWYDPQTRTGKMVDTGLQTVLMMGRNWLTNPIASAAITSGVTAGTEGAGYATGDNPWARFFGGVVGGGVPAVTSAMRSRPGAVVREAIGNPTPAEMRAAIATQDTARNAGLPLLGTESLDRGHQLASAVLAHPSGNPVLEPFLRQRPGQVETAVNRDIIAQTGPRDTPTANAARAQQAATDVITNLQRDRTNLVAPDYFMARNEAMPQSLIEEARRKIAVAAAYAPESESGMYKPYIADLSAPNATNAGVLDEIYRRARDNSKLGIDATSQDKQAAAAAKVTKPLLEDLTNQSPNLARGRQQYADFTRDYIEPTTAGPVGVVAGKRGFDPAEASPVPRITSAIADTNQARPQTIRELYTNLNAVDRQAFPGIVQTHLENQLNTALGDLRSGPNPTAGQKFRQAIAGTPQDRANFDEMMRGVAIAHGKNPAEVVKGANVLLDVLDRTGRTPGVGSPTQPRGEVAKEMASSATSDLLRTASASPLKPLADRLDRIFGRNRYTAVARALTAPDSVQQLAKMAKLNPNGLTASYYAAALLGVGPANGTDQ